MPRLRFEPVSTDLFSGDVLRLARALIGRVLVHSTPEGRTAGRIIETEAYAANDPASHSFNGESERNRAMFGPPGHAYVYLSYGVHWCFNVTAGREGLGAAVLIRALEPLEGTALMARRRGTDKERLLAAGPGRLTQAMAITDEHDGSNLVRGALRLVEPPGGRGRPRLIAAPRIGISKAVERPWRFCLRDSPFVSSPRPRVP